jgi:hypothetical protein
MSTTVPSPVVLTILLKINPSTSPSRIQTIIDIGTPDREDKEIR